MADTTAERLKRLAEAVRRSLEVHRDTVACRNAEILAASDAGWTHGQIAKIVKLERATVKEIIANGNAQRARTAHTSGGT